MPVMKAMKAMKAMPMPKPKAKPKAKANWATVNEHRLPVAEVPETRFSLFTREANGKWMLALVGDTMDAKSFIFNHIMNEYGMNHVEAVANLSNFYMTTVGGKLIPKKAILSKFLPHMSHVDVHERRRGGMPTNAVCGFEKLTKDNITEALALIGKKVLVPGNKADMAEALYYAMANMSKQNKQLKNQVEYLEREIQNMQDFKYELMEVLV
jgi:hypothetical protein